jgi:hypothetical protein
MIIGVDYQPGGQAGYKPQEGKDVLTDADVCLRDATLIQRLGVRDRAPIVSRNVSRIPNNG